MAINYKGKVSQVTSDSGVLDWHNVKPWAGNEIKLSALTSIDATLDTSRFHIAMPLSGVESYWVDGQHFKVKAGEYFIFNPNQKVQAFGNFDKEVKGYCLFLTEKTICETVQVLNSPFEKSLDSPFNCGWQQQEFMVKTYQLEENSFGRCLHRLRNKLNEASGKEVVDWDAVFQEIATEFLHSHRQIGHHLQSIPCVRTLTKQEIYRRLSIAYGFILENFEQPISLDELQKEALLSKYHLVRLYRQVYGLTPYQHLLQKRIEKAKKLLSQDYSPTETAIQLSFSDRRAFAKVFKEMVGVPPSIFQQKLNI